MNLLAALVVGAAATSLSLVSNPVGSVSPIKIKSCDVAYIDESGGGAGAGVMTDSLQFTNGVTLTLENPTDKVVTGFTVTGSYNTYHVTDTWSGSLRPGASLSVFKHFQQLPYSGSKAKCSILKVTYADGSTWSSTTAPVPSTTQ